MRKNIIIIGGGIAGLSAAATSRECRVTLLEAKDRFGGRICTQKTESGLVELGAEFIHGCNKSLLDAIHDARLSTHSVSKQNQYFVSGKLEPFPVWEKFGELTDRIDPNQRDPSFLQFLETQSLDKPTRRKMIAFAEGFNAAHADRLSAHSLRRAGYSAAQMDGEEQSRIDQGYSALVDFFVTKAQESGATLHTDTVVHAVRWQRGQVEVEATRDEKVEIFTGDAAIVTLPLGVLKARDVTFEPALPDKEEAITGLEFGNVVKIVLVFQKPGWPGRDFGFIHALDEALPTWWSDPRGATLVGWAGGSKADALAAHSPAQLETLALEILSRLFPCSVDAIRAQFISSYTHDWQADPHVRGAYSYISVNGLFLPKQLGAPVEGTLFFAGEATAQDAQTGTVFAALESGLRVAREIGF